MVIGTQVFIFFLFIYIIIMTIISVLIFLNIVPRIRPQRALRLPDQPNSDWSCTITLTGDTLFAVDQSITVEIELLVTSRSKEENIQEPTVRFPDAHIDGEEAEIRLIRENGVWYATEEIIYYKPGPLTLDYNFGFAGSVTNIGKIEPANAIQAHRTNRYILLFSAITSILAAGSLIVALQP